VKRSILKGTEGSVSGQVATSDGVLPCPCTRLGYHATISPTDGIKRASIWRDLTLVKGGAHNGPNKGLTRNCPPFVNILHYNGEQSHTHFETLFLRMGTGCTRIWKRWGVSRRLRQQDIFRT
jgi:hypothetical protein